MKIPFDYSLFQVIAPAQAYYAPQPAVAVAKTFLPAQQFAYAQPQYLQAPLVAKSYVH